jgi:hypothetical protein
MGFTYPQLQFSTHIDLMAMLATRASFSRCFRKAMRNKDSTVRFYAMAMRRSTS